MQIQPIDVTALISAILGISIVLIPVLGLTARFALKPVAESLARFFEHRALDETVQILERRVALLEQHVESLDGSVRQIGEAQAFDRALGEGGGNRSVEGERRP